MPTAASARSISSTSPAAIASTSPPSACASARRRIDAAPLPHRRADDPALRRFVQGETVALAGTVADAKPERRRDETPQQLAHRLPAREPFPRHEHHLRKEAVAPDRPDRGQTGALRAQVWASKPTRTASDPPPI